MTYYPDLAQIQCQYDVEYFFNKRQVKQHDSLTVLNIFNPNEYVVGLNFAFSQAIFTVDDESIVGETFYVAGEWSRDARVTINEEAEAAFNAADESIESKNFRDYTVNDVVLVKAAGFVRRGCVLSCSNNICEVLCVDYGVKLRCSTSQLRIAPPNVAHTRFLAIPCVLNGVGRSPSRKIRKYVSELINQLDRSSAEIVVLNKDERALQHIDILFKDKANSEKIGVVKYLEQAGLIKSKEHIQPKCVYDFSDLLRLVANATPIDLSPEKTAEIQRTFVKPEAFLATNMLAVKLGIKI